MSVRSVLHSAIGGALVWTASIAFAAQNVFGDLSVDLHWRLLGPFRAGWSSVAAGISGQPDTFYFGAAGVACGRRPTRANLAADIRLRCGRKHRRNGDCASDASVIYVGTGQISRATILRRAMAYTKHRCRQNWQHIGLDATRHIGAILVDAHDANNVLIGALGHYFGPNRERGVSVPRNGGKTWQQTLFIDADTGVADLRADPENPAIVYAAAWQVRNFPWLSYFQRTRVPAADCSSPRRRQNLDAQSRRRLAGWRAGRIGLARRAAGAYMLSSMPRRTAAPCITRVRRIAAACIDPTMVAQAGFWPVRKLAAKRLLQQPYRRSRQPRSRLCDGASPVAPLRGCRQELGHRQGRARR